MAVDIVANGHNQFFQVPEDPSLQPIRGEVTKEALDHVQPGRARRREVHVEARVSLYPSLHGRMFMSRVVVADDVNLFVARCHPMDVFQET